jgi:ribonuclease HI
MWWNSCGGKLKTTNQEMELTAMYNLLKEIPQGEDIVIYSDSAYVLGGLIRGKEGQVRKRSLGDDIIFEGWIGKWQQNNWRQGKNKEVAHKALWQAIVVMCTEHLLNGSSLYFQWVKGHSDNEGNDKADVLANLGVPLI